VAENGTDGTPSKRTSIIEKGKDNKRKSMTEKNIDQAETQTTLRRSGRNVKAVQYAPAEEENLDREESATPSQVHASLELDGSGLDHKHGKQKK